ncbi:MAG: DinB family protein [Deinococcaceae bacterium]
MTSPLSSTGYPLTDLFRIVSLEGYSPKMGLLVSMLNYVRHTTLRAVSGMTLEELDYNTGIPNSIGALLSHIWAVENYFQIATFQLTSHENYDVAIDLAETSRSVLKGITLDEHIHRLNETRKRTLSELAARDDAWLEIESVFRSVSEGEGMVSNNHMNWFHVLEDEINHRGQIQLIRKHLITPVKDLG